MALCIFAKDEENQGFITVDNIFIKSYMSDANADQIKVYLFGLYLCSQPLSKDNTIDHMSNALSLSLEKIKDAFSYWEDKGLININSYDPLQIQYHSPKNRGMFKTYIKEKYSDFNTTLDSLFPNRFIQNPNEYIKYYDFIESSNISPDALLLIVKYCINQTGNNVSDNYVLKTAKSWIEDGIRTPETIEKRIRDRELNTGILREIAVAIGKTSSISEEDKDFYTKWTETWGFDKDAILAASKKSLKSMQKLDAVLDDCFRHYAMSAVEVKNYLKDKKYFTELAIRIANCLGTWYDNPAPIIENYISPWLAKSFSEEALILIANYCFKNSIKKLEGMDEIVNKLYKEGTVSDSSVNMYFDRIQDANNTIKEILEITGTSRSVTLIDRDAYEVWTKNWGFDKDTIKYIASLCAGKPFNEIAKKLSILKDNNIYDINMAKSYFANYKKQSTASKKFNANDRPYNKEEFESSLISADEIDSIEV